MSLKSRRSQFQAEVPTQTAKVTCEIPVCRLDIFCNLYSRCFGFEVTTLVTLTTCMFTGL